jgi:histidinol-phosphate aminotransferase
MDTPMPSDNALASALNNIKPEIRSLKGYTAPLQGKVVAKLNQNENPYDILPELKSAIFQELQRLEWPRYPQYSPASIRQRLAARFDVTPDQILLGHGSNQLLYLMGSSVITPGDRVIISPPTFSLFELVMRIYQAHVVNIQKIEFGLDMERILEAAPSARLILLCSPDNPTGAAVPLGQLKAILDRTVGLVLWDEAYVEFGGETALPLLGRYPNLVISRTFSKAFGLAGLRFGYMIAHPALAGELQKANIPYNVNSFTLTAVNTLLDHSDRMDEQVRKIIQERQKLFDGMRKITQIKPYKSEANFILFEVSDKRQVFETLKSQGILVRDAGNSPPLDRCLRVTIGTPEENNIFLQAMEKIMLN